MSALPPSRSYRITGYSPPSATAIANACSPWGFLPGAALRVVRIAPLGDPISRDPPDQPGAAAKDLALLTLVPLD